MALVSASIYVLVLVVASAIRAGSAVVPRRQRDVVQALESAGLRANVKVMVGGAPVTPEWAAEIGADGFGEDAARAVTVPHGVERTPFSSTRQARYFS